MAKPSKRTAGSRPDAYQEITDRILAMIEAGTTPWQRPWDRPRLAGVPALPVNAITGRPYHGINVLLLLSAALRSDDPRWCGYRQAESRGWQVRHGERGTTICFYKLLEITSEHRDDGDAVNTLDDIITTIPLLRRHTVFHASQIEGIPTLEEIYGTREPLPEHLWEREAHLEALLARCGAHIIHRGDRAFYQPGEDRIVLPPRERFRNALAYYGTAFHELGHWTGHEQRLDRSFAFGRDSPDYAREELRAELASTFLSAELGIQHNLDEHAAYLAMYLELLRQDKKEIFRAAKDAQAIADLILDRHPLLRLEQGVAVPRTKPVTPLPAGESLVDEPAPTRAQPQPEAIQADTLEAVIAAHLRLVRGALDERETLDSESGALGCWLRRIDAAFPLVHGITSAPTSTRVASPGQGSGR